MALVKCPECGHDVSTLADRCPNCGMPITDEIGRQVEEESPSDRYTAEKKTNNEDPGSIHSETELVSEEQPEGVAVQTQRPERKNRKIGWIVLFSAALVAVILSILFCVGVFHFHEYDGGVVTKPPTCISDGVKTYTCEKCGEYYTETIKKTDHNYEHAITVEATCEQEGVRTFTCKWCGNQYTQVIEKKNHIPDSDIPAETITVSTCEQYGSEKCVCKFCGEEFVRETKKQNHNYVDGVCTCCGKCLNPWYFHDVSCTTSYGYTTISGSLKNCTGSKTEYVKVKVELLDGDKKIIDTDWTYACGSEGLKDGASCTWSVMFKELPDFKYYRYELMDYDTSY